MPLAGYCFDIAEAPVPHAAGALVVATATPSVALAVPAPVNSSPLPIARPLVEPRKKMPTHLASHPHNHHQASHLQSGLHDLQDTPQHLTEIAAEAAGVPHHTEQHQQQQQSSLFSKLPSLVAHVGGYIQPQGDCPNDNTNVQRAINVATSLPFLAIGAHMLRRHRTPEGKQYAASMLAVGTAATLYHATSGRTRRIMRKADYWAISVSSAAMMNALFPQRPLVQNALKASLCVVPFKPFVMSMGHALTMQAEFARQAVKHKEMRPHFRRHLGAAVAGIVAFALEDVLAEKGFEHCHAIWHCLAAAGVASTGALVEHKERLRLEGGDRGGRGMPPSSSSRRLSGASSPMLSEGSSYHDSVLSLESLVLHSTTKSKGDNYL